MYIVYITFEIQESNVTFNCVVHKVAVKAVPKAAFQKYSEK